MGRKSKQEFVYPPSSWRCPTCSKEHSKPHYKFPGQIDYSKKPGEEGRVVFNRTDKDGYRKGDTPYKAEYGETGSAVNEHGLPNPIFCSHCGFEDNVTYIVKNFVDCCIRGCPNIATNHKDGKYPTCDDHVGVVSS